jgi:hypothetical protein
MKKNQQKNDEEKQVLSGKTELFGLVQKLANDISGLNLMDEDGISDLKFLCIDFMESYLADGYMSRDLFNQSGINEDDDDEFGSIY